MSCACEYSIHGIEERSAPHHHLRVTSLRAPLRPSCLRRDDSRHLLEAALEIAGVAIVTCAADGRLTRVNCHARELLGASCPALGTYPDTWVGDLRPRTASGIAMPIEDLPPMRALQGEVVSGVDVLVSLPGGDVLLETAARPASDARGRTRGAVVTLADVTGRRRDEGRIRDGGWAPWKGEVSS
jgi:PAS domain-containing protein